MRNAEEYTVSVRREYIEGEHLYVARVEELPDVEEYADSFEMARELALDTISTTQEVFEKQGRPFPSPKSFHAPSTNGRVTLRLPKSVHALCISESEKEGVSLNTYILTCITSYRKQLPEQEIVSSMLNPNEITTLVHALGIQRGYDFRGNRKPGFNLSYEVKGTIDRVSFVESGPDLPITCFDVAANLTRERFRDA